MRGQGRCPKGPGGRRAAAGRPPSLRTWPCPTRSDRQPATATRGDSSRALWGSCCCILRARWAAGTPHMPPRPGTAGMERQHATGAAALLGRLPRLPSTRLGQAGRLRTATRQPAMIKPSRFAKKKRRRLRTAVVAAFFHASKKFRLHLQPSTWLSGVHWGAATSCLTLLPDGMAGRSSTEQPAAQCPVRHARQTTHGNSFFSFVEDVGQSFYRLSRGVLKAFWQGLGAPGLGWF